jgi:hypothetical protein
LLRYYGSGRVHRGHPEVLVSSSLFPWRHELQVIQRMRRLSALRLEVDVQEAASLALRVWGQVEQGIEEAPGEVFVVMRDAMDGGAHRGVRKAGVERQWELARVERRHGPGRGVIVEGRRCRCNLWWCRRVQGRGSWPNSLTQPLTGSVRAWAFIRGRFVLWGGSCWLW